MPRVAPDAQTRVPIVAPQKILDAEDNQIGQDVERKMKSTGPAREALEDATIQVVDRPVDKEKLAMLKFMEEPVTVLIHTTNNPTDEQIFQIFNGGQSESFKRGEEKTVKRKFVEVLASRKTTTFTQERKRGDDGVMYDAQIPHTALRYPFSIMRDDHPRGADWLRATLAQA